MSLGTYLAAMAALLSANEVYLVARSWRVRACYARYGARITARFLPWLVDTPLTCSLRDPEYELPRLLK